MRLKGIAYSTGGCALLKRIASIVDGDFTLSANTSSDALGIPICRETSFEWMKDAFENYDAVVSIGAIGIAVRHIAPFIKRKDIDPAVVVVDESGRYVIPILSGHLGGANRLAEGIAKALGAQAVITTATDLHGRFSVDLFAGDNHLRITSLSLAKEASARILDGRFVGFSSKFGYEGTLPEGLTECDSGEFGIRITDDPGDAGFDRSLALIPMDTTLGVGCRRGADYESVRSLVLRVLGELELESSRVRSVNSIDLKKNEPAIRSLAREFRSESNFYTAEQLMSLDGRFSKSDFVMEATSVDCVCERSAVYNCGRLIRRKTSCNGVTVAVALSETKVRFG